MGQDKITAEEREMINQAMEQGRVQSFGARVPARLRPSKPLPASGKEPAGKTPQPRRLPAELPVKDALEWAFCTEKAGFDFDEIGASSGGHRRGISMEQLILERHMLGNVSIDTSGGRSSPAEDAEVIASIVRSALPWGAACFVAEHARAKREPDWMKDAHPQIVPLDWVYGRGGRRGRTADAARLGGGGWPHWKRRNRKGAIVDETVLFTPITWAPTARQVASARRMYLDWWGNLLDVSVALRSVKLSLFKVNSEMPPLTPWRD